jgi:MFS family permease
MVTAALQARQAIDRERLTFFAKINLFGLGLLGFWTVIDTLLLPDLAKSTAPASLTGSAVGLISVVGVGLAVLVQPVAGRVSDAWRGDDTRRPFILTGLALLAPGIVVFGLGSHFVFVLAGFVLMQFATNIAQAAFQALIPDLVETDQRGAASGIKNMLSVTGAAVGLLGGQAIKSVTGSTWLVLLYLGVLIGTTGLLTVHWTPKSSSRSIERPSSIRAALDVREMLGEFRQTLTDHRLFRLAVFTQFFFLLGCYPAQRFLLLFLRDRFGEGVERRASVGVVFAILLAVIAALLAGAVSDKTGRKPVLMFSVIIGSIGLILIGFSPSLSFAALAGGLIAIGLGAFQAANWALINDDLPEGQSASTLGVANIATAGAGTLAGLFGPLADLIDALVPQATYHVLFGLAGIVASLSLIPLSRVPGSRDR